MPFSGNKTQYVAVIALIVSMIIWSVSGIAIKHALVALPPFTMILMRFIPSVLLMLVIGIIRRKHSLFCLQKMERKDLSTSPLLSPIFAAIILRERITRNNILGILISTVGVFVLTLVGTTDYSIGSYWGVLLAFMAVSAAVIDSVMMRKAPLRYSALSFVFYTQVVSLLFFIPVWFWREGPSALMAIDWSQLSDPASSLTVALWSVSYLTIFASVTAFILFCFALRLVGVTQANAFNNIRPVFTALWMFLFFGEQLPALKWVGMAVIILGLFICQKQDTKTINNKQL